MISLILLFLGRSVGRAVAFRSHVIVSYLRMRGSRIGNGVKFDSMPVIRVDQYSSLHIGDQCHIDHRVVFWQRGQSRISIGERVYVGIGTIINSTSSRGNILIDDDTAIAAGCLIQDNDHGTVLGTPISQQPMVSEPIIIGRDCWLGAHVCVLKGVTLGDGCIIGAGAVVTKDVPSNSVQVGVPARQVKIR